MATQQTNIGPVRTSRDNRQAVNACHLTINHENTHGSELVEISVNYYYAQQLCKALSGET